MIYPRNSLFICIFSFFIFSACDDCEERVMEFTIQNNRSIEIDPSVETIMQGDSLIDIIEYGVRDGQDMLFQFLDIFNFCEADIADGTSATTFSMIIPADSTNSFSYTNEEILQTSAYLDIFAAPSSLPHQYFQEGEITGERIDDNTWMVSIDVVSSLQEYGIITGDQPQVVSFQNIFTLE